MKELKDYSTAEILEELLRREKSDFSFEKKSETNTSIIIKFYK
jgi:hypothetical protein